MEKLAVCAVSLSVALMSSSCLAAGQAPPPRWASKVVLVPAEPGDVVGTSLLLRYLQAELRARGVRVEQLPFPGPGPEAEAPNGLDTVRVGVSGTNGDFHVALVATIQGIEVESRFHARVSSDGLGPVLEAAAQGFVERGVAVPPGETWLVVRAWPPETTVTMAGRPLCTGDGLILGLRPGHGVLRFEAPHHLPREVPVELPAGGAVEFSTRLEPGMDGLPGASAPTLYSALAAGVLAIAGGTFGVLTSTTQDEYDSTKISPETVGTLVDLEDRGERYATLANVCLGLAGAAALAAGGLYTLDWLAESRRVEALGSSRSGEDEP